MPREEIDPPTYHWGQIALHWLVALLVAVQYATGGSIERTHSAVARGLEPESLDLTLHAIHNRAGLVIFGLMLIRLAMRLLIGAPSPTVPDSGWQIRLARAMHFGFYFILLIQASTGAIASYLFWPVSVLHVTLSKVLLALITLHAFAAIWHFSIKRDGVMERMIPLRALRYSRWAGREGRR
jgi:cytochrome b561